VRVERHTRHVKNIGPDGGSRNSPSAVTRGVAKETAWLAGGVQALTSRALSLCHGSANDHQLEVALHLLDAATIAAEDEVLAAGQAWEDVMQQQRSSKHYSWQQSKGSKGRSPDGRSMKADASNEEAALRQVAALRDAAGVAAATVAARLSARLVEDP